MKIAATEYANAAAAIEAAKETEAPILLDGRCLVVPERRAYQLEEQGVAFAYVARHEGRIVTIPVN